MPVIVSLFRILIGNVFPFKNGRNLKLMFEKEVQSNDCDAAARPDCYRAGRFL